MKASQEEIAKDSEEQGWLSTTTKETRELSIAERAKLSADNIPVSDYRREKLEREARLNWDKFYKRNKDNFFKDRNWTAIEFQRLLPDVDLNGPLVMLEAGCGVGNFILPFLQTFPAATAYACDFAKNAVDLLKSRDSFDGGRCVAFVADVTEEPNPLQAEVPSASVDVATLIFVLSAVSPPKMAAICRNLFEVVRPGGSVVVRDYGLYDHAMLRFQKGKRIQEAFYVRQDGTRAYYFSLDVLSDLFTEAGFLVGTVDYVLRKTINKKEGLDVPRIFVQARFMKPS